VKLSRRAIATATAGALGAGGLGLVLAAAPMASAATTSPTKPSTAASTAERVKERVTDITSALKGLVSGGTLTQAQADKVASTLASSHALGHEGWGGHGRFGGAHLDLKVAATAIGINPQDLRTALQANGASVATVAKAKGVTEQKVIDALVTAETTRINNRVSSAKLTRAEADTAIAALPARVKTAVERARPAAGRDGRRAGRPGGASDPNSSTAAMPSAPTAA